MTTIEENDVAVAWGLRCPQCGRSDHIDIAATVWVRLHPEGSTAEDAFCRDHEWDGKARARCDECGFCGEVRQFEIAIADT